MTRREFLQRLVGRHIHIDVKTIGCKDGWLIKAPDPSLFTRMQIAIVQYLGRPQL